MSLCWAVAHFLFLMATDAMGIADNVAFLKNNIDHKTNATFGCHENYLMRRETDFTEANMAGMLAFLRAAPADTRAHARGIAVSHCMETREPCVFNWDSLSLGADRVLAMPDPLATYENEVRALLAE